ncbi:MAG: hypothetical protein Q9160_006856 [Pyrenula sp. 1 TL-2023]
MPYLPSLNDFLHQSSLLLQAYPSTRITTRYSLPRKHNPRKSRSGPTSQQGQQDDTPMPDVTVPADSTAKKTTIAREKPPPAATLTVKAYHPDSGICLKYKTDKAQEVGRLMGGLGKLGRGETVEEPSVATAGVAAAGKDTDPGEVDGVEETVKRDDKTNPANQTDAKAQQLQQQQGKQAGSGGGGGVKKKKKGKR